MLEYGYRSACCKAPIRMGRKKQKKTGIKINVWVCTKCETKDIDLITKDEALRPTEPVQWWDDESDDGYAE